MGTVHWMATQRKSQSNPKLWNTIAVFYLEKDYTLAARVSGNWPRFNTPNEEYFSFPHIFNRDDSVNKRVIMLTDFCKFVNELEESYLEDKDETDETDEEGPPGFQNLAFQSLLTSLDGLEELEIPQEEIRILFWQDQ